MRKGLEEKKNVRWENNMEYEAFRCRARDGKRGNYIAFIASLIETIIIFIIFVVIMYVLVVHSFTPAR